MIPLEDDKIVVMEDEDIVQVDGGDIVEVEESFSEEENGDIEAPDYQPTNEVAFRRNVHTEEFNTRFRVKLQEPAQNCLPRRGPARCCFTLWVCGNLWCALQVACTIWIIVRTEVQVESLDAKSFGIRWGIISTAFGAMALYGLHRCVPEFVLLYVGAFATAIAAIVLDTVIDGIANGLGVVELVAILLLMAFGVWGSIVFYRIYEWANYFKHVKGGYDPQMRSPLIL